MKIKNLYIAALSLCLLLILSASASAYSYTINYDGYLKNRTVYANKYLGSGDVLKFQLPSTGTITSFSLTLTYSGMKKNTDFSVNLNGGVFGHTISYSMTPGSGSLTMNIDSSSAIFKDMLKNDYVRFWFNDKSKGFFQLSSFKLESLSMKVTTTPVPVPTTAWLLAFGLIGLVGIRRRFNK